MHRRQFLKFLLALVAVPFMRLWPKAARPKPVTNPRGERVWLIDESLRFEHIPDMFQNILGPAPSVVDNGDGTFTYTWMQFENSIALTRSQFAKAYAEYLDDLILKD